MRVSELTREQAREAAEAELSRRPYQEAQPPLAARVVTWVIQQIGELLDRVSEVAPGGLLGVLLLIGLFALVLVVVLVRLRPARGGRSGEPLFAGALARTAAEHRAAAQDAADRGEFAEAIRERLRAVVRALEERGVLDPQPGRTAHEIAATAGAALPGVRNDLGAAAELFDAVWYGGRPADAAGYARVVAVDERVAAEPVA